MLTNPGSHKNRSDPELSRTISNWRDITLELMSDRPSIVGGRLKQLSNADWLKIQKTARLHRLEPLFHVNGGGSGLAAHAPDRLKRRWAVAFLQSKRRSMSLAREIAAVDAIMRQIGVDYTFLKGPQLGWSCYPEAALRPMRDLDILVTPENMTLVQNSLLARGYTCSDNGQQPNDSSPRKHLPPIISPGGDVSLEVHGSVVSPIFYVAHKALDTSQLLERAVQFHISGQAYPALAPTDALLHYVVHCAHEHFFGSGPLVLSDMAYLVRRHETDWPAFWRRAEQAGAADAAAALLSLTRLVFDCEIVFRADAPAVGSQIIESVKRGLLKDWTQLYASMIVGELTEVSSITSLWTLVRRRFRGYGSALVTNRLGDEQVDSRGRLSGAFRMVRVLATLAYYALRQVRTDIKLRRLVASHAQHRVD